MSEPADVRVIHVEDDPDVADLVADALERADGRITVESVPSPDDALDRLGTGGIDCVVSDYEMPGRDGIELLSAIREDRPDLPFILYTGKGSEEVASEAISAGVTDYLQKTSGRDHFALMANRIIHAVERFRAGREADRVRARLGAIVQHTADAIVILDAESRIRFANSAIEEVLGYPPGAVEGESVTALMPPRHRRDHLEALDRYLATGERTLDWHAAEFDALHRAGHEVPVSVSFGEYDRDGERRFVGIIRDVSDRLGLTERLREREVEFRELAETIDAAVWMTDPEREELRYANPAFEGVWGPIDRFSDDPRSLLDAVHPDDRDRVQAAIGREAAEGYDEEYRIRRPDGQIRWVRDRVIPIEDGEGEVTRLVGLTTDVTARKEREEELERITSEYRAVFDNTDDGIFLVDVEPTGDGPEFRFERLNAAHESISGMQSEEIRGQTPREALGEAAGAEVAENYRRCVEAGETIRYEEVLPMPSGPVVWETKLTPVFADGAVTRIVGVARDVTDRVEHERRLERQTERLDQFASILSHDLRNPLNVAEGAIDLAGSDVESDHLDTAERAIQRSQELIDDVLEMARHGGDSAEPEPVDLAATVEGCWGTIETASATLSVEADSTVRADPGQFRQLLENLLRNAVEHGGEAVTVTVGELDDGFFVEDDGPGIPEADRQAVFEPGYSTTDDGIGLGLDIVAEIADGHDWEVRATSGEAGGARVEFRGVEG